jgi:hypothetical protein
MLCGRALQDGPEMKFEGRLQGRELTPRAARIDVLYDALVRFDGTATEAMILNLSSKGFRLRMADELEPDTEITLEVDKLEPVRGVIRWICGEEAGGVFLEAIAL